MIHLGTRLTIAGQTHHVIGVNGTGEIVSVTNPGRHFEIHIGVVQPYHQPDIKTRPVCRECSGVAVARGCAGRII